MSDELTQIDDRDRLVTYRDALNARDELVWKNLKETKIYEAIDLWLSTFGENTSKNYRSGMNQLIERGLINPLLDLQAFALVNHETIIDTIKMQNDWYETTRQARAACYISFTGFLARRTKGLIKKAIPSREGANQTFYKYRDQVKTEALNQSQWLDFFHELKDLNTRDCIIAKVTLQGGKRISEVLSLQSDQLNFEEKKIRFYQSKSKGVKETVIFYPESIMRELQEYLGERSGLVFITRNGKHVPHIQVYNTFIRASKAAGLPIKVTPHVLRASAITFLKQQGFSDSDIMRISGHANSQMVNAYDKTPLEDNPSRRVNLVS